MPTDAATVDALERRAAAATSVDSISVDKDVLREFIAAWRAQQAMRDERKEGSDGE